jgi:hypothetical protein
MDATAVMMVVTKKTKVAILGPTPSSPKRKKARMTSEAMRAQSDMTIATASANRDGLVELDMKTSPSTTTRSS